MAENKRYYFLQMPENFFTSKRIKRLRSLAGGDTFTIIYLKMQLKAMNNHGVLEFDGIGTDIADEIALDIDENVDNVRITVDYLEKCGLLEIRDTGDCYLPYAEVNVGSITASTVRSRKSRELKSVALQHDCNAIATNCNGDIDIDIDKEIEIDKEIDKDIEGEIVKRDKTDYQQIADMYNETCVSFPKLVKLSQTRKKAIKARLNTYTVEDFKKLFEMAEQSDFLKGNNKRNWTATFDWLIKDSNMAKVLEGNYVNRYPNQNKIEMDSSFRESLGEQVIDFGC